MPMNQAAIYTNHNQECERMSSLLRTVDSNFQEYVLGVHFSNDQFQKEFGAEATYPQITLDGKHIGNIKETLRHMNNIGLIK
tara:strand:- start:4586 stop:4831 length:246 start_codon:yes stop_codon:yes gene_type:complete